MEWFRDAHSVIRAVVLGGRRWRQPCPQGTQSRVWGHLWLSVGTRCSWCGGVEGVGPGDAAGDASPESDSAVS